MITQNWIPKPNEIVRYNDMLFYIVSVNFGGKCEIKKHTTTKRITKKLRNIDITELQKVN